MDLKPSGELFLPAEMARRLPAQVGLVRRNGKISSGHHFDLRFAARVLLDQGDDHLVEKPDRLQNRLDLMIAVMPLPQDLQVQVDLGGRAQVTVLPTALRPLWKPSVFIPCSFTG